MDRTQAIEKATHFRMGAIVIDSQTGEEKFIGMSPRWHYYIVKVGEGKEATVSYHAKKHDNELVPSLSKAKNFIRLSGAKCVAAKDKSDEMHMRLLIAERVVNG